MTAADGRDDSYIPGWDCHGLPIEHKSLKALGVSQAVLIRSSREESDIRTLLDIIQISHLQLTPQAIREAARKTAEEAIEIQKTEFRALGVMADWDSPSGTYRTMGKLLRRVRGWDQADFVVGDV